MVMSHKEQILELLNVKVPSNLIHYNINVYDRRYQDHPEVSIFTNSKGKIVARFNHWDDIDGIKIVK